MTIEQVLAQVDELKPNTYDDNSKITWLSELDGQIYNDIILTHERVVDEEEIPFTGYDFSSMGTELLAPFPYDKMYRDYIFAKIDYSNGESDRYINSATTFNAAYKEFMNWYNRTHKPISKALKF